MTMVSERDDPQLLAPWVGDGFCIRKRGPLSLVEIASLICASHQVTLEELRGPSRKRRIAWARQAFMAAAIEPGSLTRGYVGIGRFLARDHTTILFGVRAHLKRMEAAE